MPRSTVRLASPKKPGGPCGRWPVGCWRPGGLTYPSRPARRVQAGRGLNLLSVLRRVVIESLYDLEFLQALTSDRRQRKRLGVFHPLRPMATMPGAGPTTIRAIRTVRTPQ
jgi:hypothetical protein